MTFIFLRAVMILAALSLMRSTITFTEDKCHLHRITRTEGWIAGLQLAALSIQGREDIARFIRRLPAVIGLYGIAITTFSLMFSQHI